MFNNIFAEIRNFFSAATRHKTNPLPLLLKKYHCISLASKPEESGFKR